MAQESIDDIISLAKRITQAEQELEIQPWVYISFECTNEFGERERIFCYDLPRDVYERREWVVRWREAKLICKYPKGNVRHFLSFYDKRLGNDTRLTSDLKTLISAKAQVTRVQNAIAKYIAENEANNMFFDENSDTDLLKAKEKLAVKIARVQAAEERLKQKINQIKNSK